MDLAAAIENLLPEAIYGGSTNENNQDCYDALDWQDDRPKPTWTEITKSWKTIQKDFPKKP